jgi:uncharacterized protein (TIGR03435 family)
MLQTLLAERFKLVLHRETRQMPVYRLLVARNGPKLQKVSGDGPLHVEMFSTPEGKLRVRSSNMAQLAGMLAMTGQLDNLVIDDTGLEGYYEFSLEWTPDILAADGAPGPSLFAALQEQLGLRLQAGKGPVEVLVIDQIQRVPTET